MAATIADVGLDLLAAADAGEAVGLEHAEQAHLDRGVHRADLVEEDRAAGRRLELALGAANAPVNEPFSWPKSSLPMSSRGIAPVCTGTNGPLRRRLRLWIARATSSLPVPLSPTISTGAIVAATRSMRVKTSRIRREPPTMPSKTSEPVSASSSSPSASRTLSDARSSRTSETSRAGSSGFCR